ncbi:MAG: immunity 53 family protein [Planctomycetota bacterium]
MSTLARFQEWYARQCNGVWEHSAGISIESCDNPGWWVKINLAGTALQGRPFKAITEGVDAQSFPVAPVWFACSVKGEVWQGAGDESQLERILQVFLAWAGADGV